MNGIKPLKNDLKQIKGNKEHIEKDTIVALLALFDVSI